MAKAQTELVPLRSPEAGIDALIGELRLSRDQLTRTLDEFEASGDEPISSRVEALSKNKIEIEQRVAHLDDCFNILDTIRLDFAELSERQAHLERSLAEVETDPNGKSLDGSPERTERIHHTVPLASQNTAGFICDVEPV